MTRTLRYLTVGAAAVFAAACSDKLTSALSTQQINAAFSTTPLGFDNAVSTYNDNGADSSHAFVPGEHGGPRGPNGLDGGFDFMGGGFGKDFLGGPMSGGGRPFDHGGFNPTSTCTYSATTGVNTCGPDTRDGITVSSTIKYTTAAGAAQQKADSTTDKIVSHVDVGGTRSHTGRGDTITTNTLSSSDRTVTGLAYNSTQRTVNGTSKGNESTTGKDSAGTFTVTRVIGDTTTGVVIPITSGVPTYPMAGTVIRSMSVSMSRSGGSSNSSSRREVVTYDGSATAKLVITQDGTTKNCTIALPHGRPNCS